MLTNGRDVVKLRAARYSERAKSTFTWNVCEIRLQTDANKYPLSNQEALNTANPEVISQKNGVTVLLRHEQR